MAVLTRIRNGLLTDGWHMEDSVDACSRFTFMYVPGHAGVAINETADSLANSCKTPVPLQHYSADIKLQTHWLTLAKHMCHSNTTLQISSCRLTG